MSASAPEAKIRVPDRSLFQIHLTNHPILVPVFSTGSMHYLPQWVFGHCMGPALNAGT